MRRSGFADTRLQLLLRTNGVRSLTVSGAAESIMPTVYDALDADFLVSVPKASESADTGRWLDLLSDSGVHIAPAEELAASWAGMMDRT